MEKLIVFVIGLIVWGIVQAVKRGQEDDAPAAKRRPVNRTVSSDIDRFLQEVDRLRKEQPPTAQPAVQVVEVVQDVRPKRKEKKDKPPPEVKPAVVAVAAASTTASTMQRSNRQQPSTFAAKAAISLLQDTNSVSTAFVLHEILGPPKCRRPS